MWSVVSSSVVAIYWAIWRQLVACLTLSLSLLSTSTPPNPSAYKVDARNESGEIHSFSVLDKKDEVVVVVAL
jgi:hypothetical protein